MAFLSQDFIDFFKELSQNNHRDWFHENKKRYQKSVKEPFYALVASVIGKAQQHEPEIQIQPKDAVFRINRDIRFSKDKTPYKTFFSAVVSKAGRRDHQYPGIYFQLGPGQSWIGGGCYGPDKDGLNKIRQSIAQNPSQLDKLLKDGTFKKFYGELKGEKNKRLPKEFKEASEKQPLIFNKQFYYMAEYEDEGLLLRDDLDDVIIDHYLAAKPLNEFLKKAMYG